MSSEPTTQNDAPADDSDDKPAQAPEKIINPRPLTLIIMLVVFLLGVGVILWAWHLGPFNTPLQQTENSYVKGNITLLSAQINGYIEKVYVTDFEDVKQGQPLVKVSSANYSQQVVQAESGLEQATTNLANQQQIIEQRKADVKAAQAKVAQVKTQLELSIQQLKRLQSLVGVGAVSQNEVDTAKAAVKNNEALMSQAMASVDVAREGQKTAEMAKIGLVAQIKSANAQLNQANTNQEYGLITAPTSGKLGQINIRTGQLVTQGTQLVYLIPKSMWVIANFKETQIDKMKIGQKAWFTVDALGKQKFTGVVKSISPATGSEFSVIKTDNATGNFTKVVQRISVRIDIQSARHTKTPLTSMDITRIIESTVRTLDAKASKGKNDPDIHCVWTSEKTTPDDTPHFHLNFFANANAIQNGYAFKDAISIAVKRRLQTTYDGLVNFSDSNGTKGKLIERNSPDVYAQIDAVVYAASYLAKARSKEFNPKWSRVSSCTRITRRTLSDSIR